MGVPTKDHDYGRCRDDDCQRYLCQVYQQGYEDGLQAAAAGEYASGYADGYADG